MFIRTFILEKKWNLNQNTLAVKKLRPRPKKGCDEKDVKSKEAAKACAGMPLITFISQVPQNPFDFTSFSSQPLAATFFTGTFASYRVRLICRNNKMPKELLE